MTLCPCCNNLLNFTAQRNNLPWCGNCVGIALRAYGGPRERIVIPREICPRCHEPMYPQHYCPSVSEIYATAKAIRNGEIVTVGRSGPNTRHIVGGHWVESDDEEIAFRRGLTCEENCDDD